MIILLLLLLMFSALIQMIADLLTEDKITEDIPEETYDSEPDYTPGNRTIYGPTIDVQINTYTPPQLVEDFKIQKSHPNERPDPVRLKVFLRNYNEFHGPKRTSIRKTSDIPYIKLNKDYMQYLADRIYKNEKVRPTYVQLWNMLPEASAPCVSTGYERNIEYIYNCLITTYCLSKTQMRKMYRYNY
jgi:hypothetical protein